LPYLLYEFGGDGPPINLAIANGFSPQTYRPLAGPLADRYRVVSLLPRALWTPPPPPGEFHTWRQMADDLLAGLREHEMRDVIAVGHSMGGVASMLAAIAEPERFRALILLDPTLLRPELLRLIAAMRALGQVSHFPLARGARRRRAQFASAAEAFAYWRDKPLFHNWSDAVLQLYVEGMTRPSANGAGVELAWPPEWEARYYETIVTDSWREVPKLRGLLPVLVIWGRETDTFTRVSARKFRRLVPEATVVDIPGHGHLFPQSAPDEARGIIEGWLASLS
jgi:pimeloyl-ACP methyl ester carboxylesterase